MQKVEGLIPRKRWSWKWYLFSPISVSIKCWQGTYLVIISKCYLLWTALWTIRKLSYLQSLTLPCKRCSFDFAPKWFPSPLSIFIYHPFITLYILSQLWFQLVLSYRLAKNFSSRGLLRGDYWNRHRIHVQFFL